MNEASMPHVPPDPSTRPIAPEPLDTRATPGMPAVPPPGITRTGRVLVADDEPFFAEALADMLTDEGFDVVGIVGDGEEAVNAVRSLQPHAVLMDLRMPRLDGIHASRIVTSEFPMVQILMLSAYEETSLRQEATGIGVFCYLVKGCKPELVIEMVRRAVDRYDLLSRRALAQAERQAESA